MKKEKRPGSHVKADDFISCIVCDGYASHIKSLDNGYNIFKCLKCHMEFIWPMPDTRTLKNFYSGYYDFRADERVLLKNAKRNIHRLNKFGLNKELSLLDYGSGKGFFVKHSRSDNWRNYDPFTSDSNEDFLLQGYYNWATLWGVIEHLVDPVETLTYVSDLLAPGSYLAATTVSIELPIPFQYKPPEHLIYWTRSALEQLFSKAGLEILEYSQYYMIQLSEVYMSIILRTVPPHYCKKIRNDLPEFVEVPTNEVFIVAKKSG